MNNENQAINYLLLLVLNTSVVVQGWASKIWGPTLYL